MIFIHIFRRVVITFIINDTSLFLLFGLLNRCLYIAIMLIYHNIWSNRLLMWLLILYAFIRVIRSFFRISQLLLRLFLFHRNIFLFFIFWLFIWTMLWVAFNNLPIVLFLISLWRLFIIMFFILMIFIGITS